MLQESIKLGTQSCVFEPNNASTWSAVRNMIANFLINQWRNGTLAGAKPEEAFFVNVGLGSTMTSDDVANGNLIVMVGVAVVRPAEFIFFRINQKMQTP